jgi:hypothetical protein
MTLSALVHLIDMTARYLRLIEASYAEDVALDDIGDAGYILDTASVPALKAMLVTAVRMLAEHNNRIGYEGSQGRRRRGTRADHFRAGSRG